MNDSNSVVFSYFLYFHDRDIHIGYGTQEASRRNLLNGRRIGGGRFALREEAEAARIKWRKKFHLNSEIQAESNDANSPVTAS